MSNNTLTKLRQNLRLLTHADEKKCVEYLLDQSNLKSSDRKNILKNARSLVVSCRKNKHDSDLLSTFLQEFGLSNKEGVALMCLAESLLRIPDESTANKLIEEKIATADWSSHQGNSSSTFVNATVWGLMLTGGIVKLDKKVTSNPSQWLAKVTKKTGEPIIRQAMLQAMRIMGGQYVLGRHIKEGIKRGVANNKTDTRFSFDMLGEGARTYEDAQNYYDAYRDAIEVIAENPNRETENDVYHNNGISIKLSALHPRYEYGQESKVFEELLPKVKELALLAKKHHLGLSIDAEEAERLDLSLDLFAELATDSELSDWNGLGFVLQAYQKRAVAVVEWLIELANQSQRKLMIRLVKGAYWDAEIKNAQEQGLTDYPVFTCKVNTDLSYQICAEKLLHASDRIFPQFATHNAYSVVLVMHLASLYNCSSQQFEYQRLHGMGDLLYKQFSSLHSDFKYQMRVYAPVGKHKDLLPYLVRRLLENGANSSFVNRFLDAKVPVEELILDPIELIKSSQLNRHSKIPIPVNLYRFQNDLRDNSRGIDLHCPLSIPSLMNDIKQDCYAGSITHATAQDALYALSVVSDAQKSWDDLGVENRAQLLLQAGQLLEDNTQKLISIIVSEAHRTIDDALSEVREAVDFCRYYAVQAQSMMLESTMSGPTGELNQLSLHGKGTFLCISPWNFPLAIFVGQVSAALITGNTVLAKPAEQTPCVADFAVKLFHQAGIPKEVLVFLPGEGAELANALLPDERLAGVAFTGSNDTAIRINKNLAKRTQSIATLIAETGGINCMIADSTSLIEQLVDDIIQSAFKSAGQRCSALRVLFIQNDIADKTINMLAGAMNALTIGDPAELSTDIGPVIDAQAAQKLTAYIEKMTVESKLVAQCTLTREQNAANYVAPTVFEIDRLEQLSGEVFGPVLHVIRYKNNELEQVIDSINNSGYGLTLGIHSRIESFAESIFRKTKVGNTYINRNIIGAVVGVNPFGGNKLSGTGPKAGGPNYLVRFVTEKTRTENLIAKGGNIELFGLVD